MKYIITKSHHDVIIFSGGITHAEMARAFGGAEAAGMVNSRFKTYGKSVSLNMDSKESDGETIQRYFEEGY